MVAFSAAMQKRNLVLKAFLFDNVYRHYKVNRMTSKAERVVSELFQIFMDEPYCLPSSWQGAIHGDRHQRARLVADYIAGMTDRYALLEHKRLFDPTVKS